MTELIERIQRDLRGTFKELPSEQIDAACQAVVNRFMPRQSDVVRPVGIAAYWRTTCRYIRGL